MIQKGRSFWKDVGTAYCDVNDSFGPTQYFYLWSVELFFPIRIFMLDLLLPEFELCSYKKHLVKLNPHDRLFNKWENLNHRGWLEKEKYASGIVKGKIRV